MAKKKQQPSYISAPSAYIPQKGRKTLPTIDDYINSYLDETDAQNAAVESFFQSWYGYLQDEREKRKDEIDDVLVAVANSTIELELVRIVDNQFGSHPLCTLGSVQGAGRRFNIGSDLRKYRNFHCLYLASDDDTAYAEKFHGQRAQIKGTLTPHELALRPKVSDYSNFGASVSLSKCIDITDKSRLKEFCDVISQIKPPQHMMEFAKQLGYFSLRTIQTPGELHKTFLEKEFLRFPIILDMPSNSQWFGLYCFLAGIQAIIFPSVRLNGGTNYAVFLDNLKGTDSFIELTTKADYIAQDHRRIDGKTFEFFKIAAASRGQLS